MAESSAETEARTEKLPWHEGLGALFLYWIWVLPLLPYRLAETIRPGRLGRVVVRGDGAEIAAAERALVAGGWQVASRQEGSLSLTATRRVGAAVDRDVFRVASGDLEVAGVSVDSVTAWLVNPRATYWSPAEGPGQTTFRPVGTVRRPPEVQPGTGTLLVVGVVGLGIGVWLGLWVANSLLDGGLNWLWLLLPPAVLVLARTWELATSLPASVGRDRFAKDQSGKELRRVKLVSLLDTYRSVQQLDRNCAIIKWTAGLSLLGSIGGFGGALMVNDVSQQESTQPPRGDVATLLIVTLTLAALCGIGLVVLAVFVRTVRWRAIATPAILLSALIAIGLARRWAFFSGFGVRWTDSWGLTGSLLQLALPYLLGLALVVGVVWYALKYLPLGTVWVFIAGAGSLSVVIVIGFSLLSAFQAGTFARHGYVPDDSEFPVHCLALDTPLSLDGRQVDGVLEIESGQARTWVGIAPADPPAEGEPRQPWDLALVQTSQVTGTKVDCSEVPG